MRTEPRPSLQKGRKMATRVLEGQRVVLPGGLVKEGPACLLIEEGKIADVFFDRPASETDLEVIRCDVIAPGFVDLHTHGLGGRTEVADYWLSPEYTQAILPRQGTTSFLATVVFPSEASHNCRDNAEGNISNTTWEILDTLGRAVGMEGKGAVMEGIYAEGPIVNDLGGLPQSESDMPLSGFEKLLDAMPSARVMTISPHLEAKTQYARMKVLLNRGILPSLGHDRVANEEEIIGALSLSPGRPMHITHLFNVCNFHHRMPSLVNFGLADSFPNDLRYQGLTPPTVELIGDLVHVHPMALSLVLKARKFSDVCFVTDSVMEGRCGTTARYSGREVQVSEDGRTVSLVSVGSGKSEGSVLAGSCCSMMDILHNLTHTLDVPIGQACAMLSENPARIAGLEHVGRIEVGRRADLLLMDQELHLRQCLVAGCTAHKTHAVDSS